MNYELEILNLKRRVEELEKLLQAKPQSQPATAETNSASNRDKTKYMLNGKVYPKNRLVLAIVKKYTEQHNPTFNELNDVFDRSLQGSLGVVETYDNAAKISDGAKRYFMKDEDVLTLGNQRVVVCTQWGIFNIVKFVKRAQSLGFEIETI
jgi:5-methylcytosine-specific restriction protein B